MKQCILFLSAAAILFTVSCDTTEDNNFPAGCYAGNKQILSPSQFQASATIIKIESSGKVHSWSGVNVSWGTFTYWGEGVIRRLEENYYEILLSEHDYGPGDEYTDISTVYAAFAADERSTRILSGEYSWINPEGFTGETYLEEIDCL